MTTELTWFAYSADESLWTAMTESALMALANIALLVLVCGRGATWRPPVFGAIGWAVLLAGIGVAGGTRTLGAVLGAAYLVQVAPAVWTVLCEPVPSGVATSTWVLIAIEALLWVMYGIVRDDPATMTFAIAAGVIVMRTLTMRRPLLRDHGECLDLDEEVRLAEGRDTDQGDGTDEVDALRCGDSRRTVDQRSHLVGGPVDDVDGELGDVVEASACALEREGQVRVGLFHLCGEVAATDRLSVGVCRRGTTAGAEGGSPRSADDRDERVVQDRGDRSSTILKEDTSCLP